jgi:hypothetical protein
VGAGEKQPAGTSVAEEGKVKETWQNRHKIRTKHQAGHVDGRPGLVTAVS